MGSSESCDIAVDESLHAIDKLNKKKKGTIRCDHSSRPSTQPDYPRRTDILLRPTH